MAHRHKAVAAVVVLFSSFSPAITLSIISVIGWAFKGQIPAVIYAKMSLFLFSRHLVALSVALGSRTNLILAPLKSYSQITLAESQVARWEKTFISIGS